jgi:hypothetical protein
MQPRVSQAVKTTVIEEWLRGLSRDAIVAKHRVSAGTVYLWDEASAKNILGLKVKEIPKIKKTSKVKR